MLLRLILSCTLLLLPVSSQAQDANPSADLILVNGRIITNDSAFNIAEAMAVRDGKIVAVGTNAALRKLAGSQTKQIDLQGQTIIPGLIDTHTHALDWARSVIRDEIDLSYPKVSRIEEVANQVEERVGKLKAGQWIVGVAWDDAKLAEKRYITRQDLDAVSPSNPVYLLHVSGHLAVVNTAGMKLAGITSQSPDPPGGVIEKDDQGQPTGILKDSAMGLLVRFLPAPTTEDSIRAVGYLSRAAAEVGLTTIHDVALSP